MRVRAIVMAILLASSLGAPRAAAQDGTWIDLGRAPWNAPGQNLPYAGPLGTILEPCWLSLRVPETDEDEVVAYLGWQLFGSYEAGWGVTIVGGLTSMDLQCRPMGYQYFVFVDKQFAGTLAPEPMNSRGDGAATSIALYSPYQAGATFARYAFGDPLCCPSAEAYVAYVIERTEYGPVVMVDW
jgi:hypothetical protein